MLAQRVNKILVNTQNIVASETIYTQLKGNLYQRLWCLCSKIKCSCL